MEQALGGVNVLDFSDGMAGGLAASICADFGAEVIKVEKPGGNSCRKMEPFVDGVSLVDSRVNRGKKSIVLDMQRAEDVKTAADLAKKTDVLIEDFSPGRMEALGLGYTSLAVKNPGLIYCSVTPYGQKGPDAHKPANELMVQALAGVMGTTGETGKTPQAHGFAMGDFAAGQTAYGSIVAALCYRLAEGKGQSIDVSIVRSLLFFNSAVERMSLGAYAGLEGNHHPTISPFGIFNGNKGQSVVICALNAKLWNALCTLMERPELAEDPRFVTVGQRAKNRMEVVRVIEAWLKRFNDINEPLTLLEKAGVPASLIFSTKDVLKDPHVQSMGWLCDAPMPEGCSRKTFVVQGGSFILHGTPGKPGAAPRLGASTQAILAGLERGGAA